MKNKNITIGIPTYEAGESLITTLNSVYAQTFYNHIDEVILVVDGNIISKNIKDKIKNPKLRIIEKKNRKGQSQRINDILLESKSDYTVLTNDDIYLEKHAIENLAKENNEDLIAGCARPTNSNNLIAKIINVGVDVNHSISSEWKNGDNYLACNGRLIMISKRLRDKIKVPVGLWNNDAYIYLVCKLNNYEFKHTEKSICYYQAPQKLSDHMKQSAKFQNSFKENSEYFNEDLSAYYIIPFTSKILGLCKTFIHNPLGTSSYIFLLIYSRFKKMPLIKNNSYWETDKSTKKIVLNE
jgi:glycosyltransferase involved in cell wall biosynthesis